MVTNKLLARLPDLAAFIVVVNQGSFTAAAKQLDVTPSALSKLMTRLEKALSVKLLERSTRRVQVTETGQAVYQQCLLMMNAAEQAIDIADADHHQAAGSITIAAPKAFLSIVLQPLVLPFLQRYPEIELKLRACDGDIDIIAEGVDAVFRLTDRPSSGLVLRELGKVRLSLCASPEYLQQRGTPKHPLELFDHDCLYLAENNRDHIWEFVQGEQAHTVEVSGRYSVNHSQMRLNGVRNHLGIGLFPDFVIKQAVASGEVVEVLSDWQIKGSYQGVIALQYAQTRYLPKRLRVFIDYIVASLDL